MTISILTFISSIKDATLSKMTLSLQGSVVVPSVAIKSIMTVDIMLSVVLPNVMASLVSRRKSFFMGLPFILIFVTGNKALIQSKPSLYAATKAKQALF
jgi:hypothetical protein